VEQVASAFLDNDVTGRDALALSQVGCAASLFVSVGIFVCMCVCLCVLLSVSVSVSESVRAVFVCAFCVCVHLVYWKL